MKKKLLPLTLLLLGAALIPVANAEIRKDTRVHVGKKSSSNYYANSYSSYNACKSGYKSSVKKVLAGYSRAGRPIYKYVRTHSRNYRSS